MKTTRVIISTFRSVLLLLSVIGLFLYPVSVLAQSYSFSLEKEVVNVYWNEDGTQSVDYVFVFNNDPGASFIEYVDVGTPNDNYDLQSVYAEVNGVPVTDITRSTYIEAGPAIGLGSQSIPPGESGEVHVFIGTVREVLYPDDDEESNYASAVFSPTWFDGSIVHGTTDLAVTFHLPPGVQPEEPRWHQSPSGWQSTPDTGFDEQGRITYTWRNPQANPSTQYLFGASFPLQYVPEGAIVRPNPFAWVADIFAGLLNCLPGLIFVGIIALIIYANTAGARRRQLQYMPPKISIEGHGIKRGLTAIEAAILTEQPMDKVLTMILFATIKKGAARVTSKDPLELEVLKPLPENLRDYEKDFLASFEQDDKRARRRELQNALVNLVKSVSSKMKGFSRRETIAYYRDIMNKAWQQVEAAGTPEVKSQKFDELMEWTMLDHNYDDRTRDIFRTGPVYVPIWWGHYDPSFGRSTGTTPKVSLPGQSGGSSSMPHLPGSDFAASMVNGVQSFSAGVIGNVSEFTSNITERTNPVPKTTSSRSGGGRSGGGCACACACAGCACACAGGGR